MRSLNNSYFLIFRLTNYFRLVSQRCYSSAYAYKRSRTHCYKNIYPWKSEKEFQQNLISSIIYDKDGLVALNKPFGVKIHSHDKPGARSDPGKHKMVASIPDVKYTIEDALPALREHLKAPFLTILKSAEKYTSGIVLLGTNDEIAKSVHESFETAKRQKTPHLIHWMLTSGCPVVKSRAERVGIKMLEKKTNDAKQPVIILHPTKGSVKKRLVRSVNVEYKVLKENRAVSSSLIEIKTSSIVYHFVRVYASNRIVPILGDVLYGSRMNTILGVPVNVHVEHAQAYEMQPLPPRMADALNLPRGIHGHLMMPTMLHLHSILLPAFSKKEDIIITAEPPKHFQWTGEQLNLIHS